MAIRCLLLLEDDDAFACMITEMLYEHFGSTLSIAHAQTVDEALPILYQESIDVAIIDLGLPGTHELSAVHRVRHQAPLVPILILTGSEDPTLQRRAEQMVAVEWVQKKATLQSDEIVQALRLLDYCRRLLHAAQQPDKVECVHRDGDHTPRREESYGEQRLWRIISALLLLIIGGLQFWYKAETSSIKDDVREWRMKVEHVALAAERNLRQVEMSIVKNEAQQHKLEALERYIIQVDEKLQRYLFGRRDAVPHGEP
jgi:DNA-binding NarL/FixJ family response regulator